ncbi:hypothetical protein GCM10028777_21870 [Angustibacter speluncae]
MTSVGRVVWTAVAAVALVAGTCGPVQADHVVSAPRSTSAVADEPDVHDVPDDLPTDQGAGSFQALAPTRLLDTRSGLGAGAAGPVPGRGTVRVQVTGRGGVPDDAVGSVVLNVTVVSPAAAGWVTVFPGGSAVPNTSNLNYAAGRTVPNAVVVPVGPDGSISLFTSATAHLLVDVSGYHVAGEPVLPGAFGSLAPSRLLDTRVGTGVPTTTPAGAGATVRFAVAGRGGVPQDAVAAVVLNVTVVGAGGPGWATVHAGGSPRPGTSNLNYVGGQTVPNLVVAPLGDDGTVSLYTTTTAHLLADVAGYLLAGDASAAGTLGQVVPARVLDTRNGTGAAAGPMGPGTAVSLQVAGVAGVPAVGVSSVVLNVTATQPSGAGWVTVHASGSPRPNASSLNLAAGQTVPNLVVAPVGPDGRVVLWTSTSTHLLADVFGYVLAEDRSVSSTVPLPATVLPPPAAVLGSTGDPSGQQTTRLSTSVPAPAVGAVLVLPASAQAPQGLLGRVTAVSTAGGERVVTTTPAALDEAYSTFRVSVSTALTDDQVAVAGAPAGGRSAAAAPSFGGGWSAVDFSCTGPGGAPTVSITADLSDVHADVSMDANVFEPYLNVLVTAHPRFEVNTGFRGAASCRLTSDALTATIPVSAAPPLLLVLRPQLTLSADGEVSIGSWWEPRAAVGFQARKDGVTESHGFGITADLQVVGEGSLTAMLGLGAEVSLAGRVGLGGAFGPALEVLVDVVTGCIEVSAALRIDLTVEADVFVRDWVFTVAKGTFARRVIKAWCGEPPTVAGLWSGPVQFNHTWNQDWPGGGGFGHRIAESTTATVVVRKQEGQGWAAGAQAAAMTTSYSTRTTDYTPTCAADRVSGQSFSGQPTVGAFALYEVLPGTADAYWDVTLGGYTPSMTWSSAESCGPVTSVVAEGEVFLPASCRLALQSAIEGPLDGGARTIGGEVTYPAVGQSDYGRCTISWQLTQLRDDDLDGVPDTN